MIAPTWPHRRRPGMWAALAVALAHLAWLQLAWRPWTSTGHAPPEPVTWLRLLPDLEAPAARARPEPPSVRAGHLTPEHTAAAPASSEHPPAIAPTAPPAPQPITLPTETRATPVAPPGPGAATRLRRSARCARASPARPTRQQRPPLTDRRSGGPCRRSHAAGRGAPGRRRPAPNHDPRQVLRGSRRPHRATRPLHPEFDADTETGPAL